MSRLLIAAFVAGSAALPFLAPRAMAQESALPAPLSALGLTEVMTRHDREDDELNVLGRLPGGTLLRAEMEHGRLDRVETDEAGLPRAALAALLPAEVLAAPRLAELATVTGIERDDDGELELEGRDAAGQRIKLTFDRAGRMTEYHRDRRDRRLPDVAATRARLTAAGYRDIDWVRGDDHHVKAIATNSWGERVEVRLDAGGEVDREEALRP